MVQKKEMEDSGDRAATLQVAQFYLWGLNTVQVDRTKAAQLLRKCIDDRRDLDIVSVDAIAEAFSLLMEILKNNPRIDGLEEHEHQQQQQKLLQAAAAIDDCCFTRSLTRVKHFSTNVSQLELKRQIHSRDAAISEIERRAKCGDPRSQAHLGIGLLHNVYDNVSESPVHWLRAAAQQGHAGAQWWLSRHDKTLGDTSEAKYWLNAGVEQGDPACLNSLGLEYECRNGELGYPHDLLRAVLYFEKAALLGNIDAQYHLGVCYLEGRGVKVDLTLAKKWHTRASSSGKFLATNALLRHPFLAAPCDRRSVAYH